MPRLRARLPWLLCGLVAVWTLVTFLPTIVNEFVNWDDPRMFLENPYHRGPWSARLRNAWSRHLLGEFMPVTWMSYSLMPTREDPMLPGIVASALTAAAISVALVGARRRWPGALATWAAYLVLLAPMSGLVPFGRMRGPVDRYTYVACLGWALVAGGAVALGWQARQDGRVSRLRSALVGGAVVALLLVWSAVSWREAAVWQNGVTLWTRAVAVVPGSPLARSSLGTALASRGDFSGAVAQYQEAAREWRTQPGALQNLGRALAADGRSAEAVEPLRRLVELRPGLAEGHLDLGVVLYNTGDVDGAVTAFSRAVELAPGLARAHESLGTALWRQGRKVEAARHLQRAVLLGSGSGGDVDLTVPRPGAAGADGS
jgi:Tetratricopeptide repeat